MKKAFVLLSGCGNRDGSEIREAVLSLLALDMHQVIPICIAPKMQQTHTINHWESTEQLPPRSAIIESARIARGDVVSIESIAPDEADLLVIPGGAGAATTLSSYGLNKESAAVLPSVQKLIQTFFDEKKPIVAICISPVLIALSLKGKASIKLTLGKEKTDLEYLTSLGMQATPCTTDNCIIDEEHKIITTPAYMGPPSLASIWKGIYAAIEAAVRLA
jgi:enhancing lycopene biosynthesis protein 2